MDINDDYVGDRLINRSTAITRTSVPFMDEKLGWELPVLDHGFIQIIDYMGDDHAIDSAARMSYGQGTKRKQEAQGLINYLMGHHHTSPFEMCEIKLRVKLPVFVARQWIRHRTACLAGDVKVSFDLPGGIASRGHQHTTLTIKDIYDRFQPSQNTTRPDKQGNPYHKRDRVKAMRLRSCDEDAMTPIHTSIVDIWQSGVKPVLRVNFPNGVLRATKDHMCLTDMGWLKLGDALAQDTRFASWGRNVGFVSEPVAVNVVGEEWKTYPENNAYEVSNKGRVRRSDCIKTPTITPNGYQVVSLSKDSVSRAHFVHHLVLETFSDEDRAGRDTRHLDGNRQHNTIDNLRWGTPSENASDRMESGSDQTLSIQWVEPLDWREDGMEMTYDMEVVGPYHNFVAGSVVVHNSVNEYSARYSILDNEFYIPEIQEITAQSTTNKQGRGEMLEGVLASEIRSKMQAHSQLSYNLYEWLLSDDVDLTRELARINLPPNIYTQWVWKTDLHNLFHFLRLRADPHAQKEIRDYAELLEWIVMGWVPMAWDAYRVYRKGAISFSAHEALMIRAALAMPSLDGDNKPTWADMLSMREWKAFIQKIEHIK